MTRLVTAKRYQMQVPIADDSAVPRLILEKALASLAHETVAADDGQEARSRFHSFRSEVLLSEWPMVGVASEHAVGAM